ncbi:MAG: hypothetical protein Q9207_003790 [Kuettlingeria erythrocarpa]
MRSSSLLVTGLGFVHPSNAVDAAVEPGVGFSLSLDYGTASLRFLNGSNVDVGRIEGDAAYRHTMRASELMEQGDAAYGQRLRVAEFLDPLADDDLRSQATQYGGNGTWAFYAVAVERMLAQLEEATELRLGTSIAAAYIVFPFDTTLAPIPARWHDLLRYVSASLGLQVPLSAVEAKDLAITKLGDPCNPAYGDRKSPLILTIDYSQAALGAFFAHASCDYGGDLSPEYHLHEPHLGATALAEMPDDFGRAHLTQALRNLTSLPWIPGEHGFTKEKIVWGPKDIDQVILIGESAHDPLLREVLVEVLGE